MERNYESMMIIRSDLGEDGLENVFNKISRKIEDLGGKVNNTNIWARERNFAYTLRSRGAEKKKFDKGCYWLINFTLDTKEIITLKEAIKLEENILRNIIINRSDK
ncbi:MAG: 30S ribosomal protein S6 [Candidatus Omnitrophica bacterium 4484_171]|nr:MAG: 30S ribosomal protein S6 [Candidatus Omnitrophica bacterium 4484_171]